MTNRRALMGLIFILAALASAHVLLSLSENGTRPLARRMTLVDATDRVLNLRIHRRDAPETALARDGDAWRLTAPFAAPAEPSTVLRLLDGLSLEPVSASIADAELLSRGRSRADYALDDPPVSVTLRTAAGEYRISFGLATASGSDVYAVRSGENVVYTVSTGVLARVNRPADAFRRRSLFRLSVGSVVSVGVKRPSQGVLSFARDGEGWQIDGRRARTQKVEELVTSVLTAEAVGFVWPVGVTNEAVAASRSLLAGYGLDPDNAISLTVKGSDGRDRFISFGNAAGENLVYALVHGGNSVVTVPSVLRNLAGRDAIAYTESRLFPLEVASVSSFSLAVAGVDYVLARTGPESWRLDAPVSAPADSEVVGSVLGRLFALSSADLRAEGVRVSLRTNAEPVVVSLESVFANCQPEALRSREILKFPPDDVRRLVSSDGRTSSSVVYDRESHAWQTESSDRSGTPDANGIKAVLDALNPLVAVRIEKLKVEASDLARYGLEKPFRTLAVDRSQADAVRRNILIGGIAPGGRFATVGSSDAVFVISDDVLAALSKSLIVPSAVRR